MNCSVPHSRPWIDSVDKLAVEEVLSSSMIARGKYVAEFEQTVACYLDASGSIACTSGTAALLLAFKVLGIGAGDEVVVPTYVCSNVLAAVYASGAAPQLCDVDDSGVLTTETVQAVFSSRTRCIVAVHIFGHACDISSLKCLGVPVIEDACQAFGLNLSDDRLAGTVGTVGILSFHATKCLTTGEGGMLVSEDSELLERARALAKSSTQGNAVGLTAMTDIQAALGLAQLKRYSLFLESRRRVLDVYNRAAQKLAQARPGYFGEQTFLFRYTLRVQREFEDVKSALLTRGVQVRRGVDELLHRKLGLDDRDFPVATELFSQIISVPFYPSLTSSEQARVVLAMQEVFGRD